MNFKPKNYGGFRGYGDLTLSTRPGVTSSIFTTPKPQVGPELVAKEFATMPNANTPIAPAPIEMNPVIIVGRPRPLMTPLSPVDLTIVSERTMREATGLPAIRHEVGVIVERPPLVSQPPSTQREIVVPDSTIPDTESVGVPVSARPAPAAQPVNQTSDQRARDFEAGASTKTVASEADKIAAKSSQEFVLNIPNVGLKPDVRVSLEDRYAFNPQAGTYTLETPPAQGGGAMLPIGAAVAGFFLGGPVGAAAGAILGSFLGKK